MNRADATVARVGWGMVAVALFIVLVVFVRHFAPVPSPDAIPVTPSPTATQPPTATPTATPLPPSPTPTLAPSPTATPDYASIDATTLTMNKTITPATNPGTGGEPDSPWATILSSGLLVLALGLGLRARSRQGRA